MGFCEFDQLDFEGALIKYILFFFSEQADKSNFGESIFILETFFIIIL